MHGLLVSMSVNVIGKYVKKMLRLSYQKLSYSKTIPSDATLVGEGRPNVCSDTHIVRFKRLRTSHLISQEPFRTSYAHTAGQYVLLTKCLMPLTQEIVNF